MNTYQDLYVIAGADFSEAVLITNPDGTAVNVALCTFSANAKASYYTPNVAFSLTVTIIDAPNGNIALQMTAANTANIWPNGYVYDLQMVDSFGNTSKPLYGIFFVEPGVTMVAPNVAPSNTANTVEVFQNWPYVINPNSIEDGDTDY